MLTVFETLLCALFQFCYIRYNEDARRELLNQSGADPKQSIKIDNLLRQAYEWMIRADDKVNAARVLLNMSERYIQQAEKSSTQIKKNDWAYHDSPS